MKWFLAGFLLLAPVAASADCGTACHKSGCLCLAGGSCKGCKHKSENAIDSVAVFAGLGVGLLLWMRSQARKDEAHSLHPV